MRSLLFFLFPISLFPFSCMHTYNLSLKERESNSFIWTASEVKKFDEVLISWNAKRPEVGEFVFSLSVKTVNWSPFFSYAEWSKDGQKTFSASFAENYLESFQDTVNVTNGMFGRGFRVKVEAKRGASLYEFDSVHVCTSNLQEYRVNLEPLYLQRVLISPIYGKSQMNLPHQRTRDLCSPTSTSTVINFLKEKSVDPCDFADRVHDDGFDIYGNWILNIAEAYSCLNGDYSCFVQRLSSFADLHAYLLKRVPVVVSVKGEIPNAPFPYLSGHLMVVIGFDPIEQRVYCIDSAYDKDEKTIANYFLGDFLKVWSFRKNLSYIFVKK